MSDRKSLPLRIFLASPGDVAQQRTQVRDIVESVNADPDRVHSEFEVVGWEQVRGTVARPQDAINELIRESHYAIVLFREKWGSNPNSPQKFTSGTEEELFQALLERASQRGLMRDVWVAFISCENAEIPVRDLKASIQSEGSLLYETISDNDDLRVKLTQRLKSWGSVQTRTPHSAKLIPSSKVDVLGIADLVDQGKFLLSIGKLDGESLLAEAARLGGAEEKLEFSQALLRIGKKGEAEEQIDLAIREYRSHSLIHTSAGTLALVRKASILRANGKNVEAISLMQTAAPRAAATTASEKLVKARLLDEWGQGLKATKENERALAKFQGSSQMRV